MSYKNNVKISNEEVLRQKQIMKDMKALVQNKETPPLAYVETLGCVQNENDSEILCGMLLEMGYKLTKSKEEAELILFNTCAVRENAEKTLLGKIGAIKGLKNKKPELILGICGCMMQQDNTAETVRRKYPYVNLIFGTHSLYKFPQLLFETVSHKRAVLDVLDTPGYIVEGMPIFRQDVTKALVSVMYGCNNFCSYCIVPYVRGRERSRSADDIIREIESLAKSGCLEVMLLGQNVNSYGKDLDEDIDFADLLTMVCKMDGVLRIRFMTSHPKDISDKLIATMAREEKICKQLHLPFQAGSNRILESMNRKYTKEQYLSLVDKVRAAMPDITLTSDVIVGFPGETNEDFEETLEVLEKARFDQIFSFIYSPREGTPAAKMENVLTPCEKQKNFEKMLDVQAAISKENNEKLLLSVQTVLVEGKSRQDSAMLAGRTEGNKIVHFYGDESLMNKMVSVKITEAKTWSLTGEILK